ncbi:hypothetical protein [Dietzia sp. 179-F 9C3 NHS]|uniref:hypothetical protein n=1 Tax=Dietzia sp. 179-F 9C3 NHS TaxID=3374295 RepID=UPI003879BF96
MTDHDMPDNTPDETEDQDTGPAVTESGGSDESADGGDEATSNTDALLADLAKARRQRNEARSQLGMTQDHLDSARRQLVDAEIIRAGFKPAGIRAGGLDETTLFDHNGILDRIAARHAIKDAARELGLPPRTNPGDNRDRSVPPKASWHDALNPK